MRPRISAGVSRGDSTAAARGEGIAFVSESRRMMLFRTEPVYKNISIAILDRIHRLLLRPQAERAIAGTRWNGPRFFGLRDEPTKGPSSS